MWSEVLDGTGRLVFHRPEALELLFLLPLFLVPWWWLDRDRRSLVGAVCARAAAFALVVLALAGLSVETRESAESLCIVVSADLSESVAPIGSAPRDQLVRSLLEALRPGDQLGGVAFGRRAEVVQWPTAPPQAPDFGRAGVDASATRLAAGIEAAVPLCPEGSERKVVLVTDGNETVGDARRAAAFARQTGVKLYAVVPGANGKRELSFEKLIAPPLVREGSVFPLRVMVRSSFPAPTPGTLEVLVNGEPAARQPVRFDPGINVFEVPYQLHERGSYRFQARVAVAGAAGREERDVSLAVAGPVRALVISDSNDSALEQALKMKEVDVEFRSPKAFPKLEELLEYHCVIVDDVPRRALDDDALRTLETYVKSFGGGLLMTGGARSFGDRGYQKSALERTLPVSFVEQKPKPKGRSPMGVFLLIDRSNSMGYNSRRGTVRDGEKMNYARQAALALIGQLGAEDRVGVIAFDSDPYVLGPLRPLSEHRAELQDRISRLMPGGGTDFKAALEIAGSQLAASGLAVRHIILLTDGDTNRSPSDHISLIQTLGKMGITVTTIRIGDDNVNLQFLQSISTQTGGRFYHVEDIEHLPQLIVSDTRQVGGEQGIPDNDAAQGRAGAPPRLEEASQAVRGFAADDFPPIREAPETRLKPGADLVMYVPRSAGKLPLLASWQYGLGRAAAFMLDPANAETSRWVRWPGFGKLWSQLVRWAIREETPWETRQMVRFDDGNPFLEVQTFDDLEEGTLAAEVFTAPQSSVDVLLVPVAPRLFRAPLPPLAPGRYALLLTRRSGDKVIAQKREVLAVESSADEPGSAELARKGPDVDLLRSITRETGGTLNPSVAELTERRGQTRPRREPIDWVVVPVALALIVGDIAIRKRSGG